MAQTRTPQSPRESSDGVAALALLGAWLTIRAIRQQIDQVERLSRKQQEAQERAARVSLAFALSEIVSYANRCMKVADPLASGRAASLPPPPAGIFQILKDCTNHAEAQAASDIAALASWFQVQQARGLSAGPGQAVIDAARLSHMASALFSYARGSEDLPRPTDRELRHALIEAGLHTSRHPEVQKVLDADP